MSQPSTLTAINGMLSGNGLDNTFVNSLFTEFYATTIITKAQQAITDAGAAGEDISDLGNNIFPGVVGNVPNAYTTVTPTNTLQSAYYTYARLLFAAGDISGFAHFFGQAVSYAQQSLSVMADVTKKNSTNLEDYGIRVKLQSDVSTAGLSGLLTVNTTQNLVNLGDDFIDLGNVFDYDNLDLFGTARGLTKLIIDSKLNLSLAIQAKIDELNLDTEVDYTDENYESILYDILSQTQVTAEFRQAFQSAENPTIKVLSDILDPLKSLKRTNNIVTFTSYTELADRFVTLRFLSLIDNHDFGKLLKTLTSPGALSNLDTVTTTISSTLGTNILTEIGSGDGIYEQPTVRDVIGPVAGWLVEERLARIVPALTTISASSDGLSIIQGYENISSVATDGGGAPYVVTGVGSGSYATKALAIAAIETALDTYFQKLKSFLEIGNLELREACQTVYNDYDAIAKQVSDSKALLTKAGINTSNVNSNKLAIMAFGNTLEAYGADRSSLGSRQIINALTTSDITGDAIKATLIAGQNSQKLSSKGLISKVI